jgi:hypothetical protein
MKLIYITLITCLIVAGSCSKSSTDEKSSSTPELTGTLSKGGGIDGGILIPLNDCVTKPFGTDSVRVCFDQVITDCRCPKNVTCVWAGFAEVELTISVNNGLNYTFQLSTLGPNTAVVAGYEIKFVDLLPYPIDGVTPAPGDIKVVVTITKL